MHKLRNVPRDLSRLLRKSFYKYPRPVVLFQVPLLNVLSRYLNPTEKKRERENEPRAMYNPFSNELICRVERIFEHIHKRRVKRMKKSIRPKNLLTIVTLVKISATVSKTRSIDCKKKVKRGSESEIEYREEHSRPRNDYYVTHGVCPRLLRALRHDIEFH